MRVICPHCRTIYQLQGLDADAVLVCHRCGTEFGLGDKPDDAQGQSAATAIDPQTPDMFAGLPVEPAGTDDAGSPAGSNDGVFPEAFPEAFPETSLPQETVDSPAAEPVAESIGQTDNPEPEDIPLYEAAADVESTHDVKPAHGAESAQNIEPAPAEEQSDEPEPVIIPARDEWPQAAANQVEKIIIS
ncbi:MAG: hypothetical protein Q9M23_06150, partial [Mariprofundaceae bacterium]|nr:hypothetical protein [Mariprofundaceae bacterium]